MPFPVLGRRRRFERGQRLGAAGGGGGRSGFRVRNSRRSRSTSSRGRKYLVPLRIGGARTYDSDPVLGRGEPVTKTEYLARRQRAGHASRMWQPTAAASAGHKRTVSVRDFF
ncbi:hypothetical protein EVAR_21654_1 [Eumeta japonica]|uniref:Uncharacterized protein n=1 Tax=Eumeta variegata TaxID=151549 RepID=A0A4C1VH63_EUMVA|nr:hypothetical protein EVAR_21654_1 [Eumeta japonica]